MFVRFSTVHIYVGMKYIENVIYREEEVIYNGQQ